MRNPLLSRGVLVLFAVCVVCLFTVTSSGHENETSAQRASVLTDWTTRHVLYPLYGNPGRISISQRDPRAIFTELRRERDRRRRPDRPERPVEKLRRDWSINLGAGGTAAGMYPAKFTFSVTATPSCANDYVIYPIDASGSATQANLVAFNNLYSGTVGGTGACNRAPVTNDDGVDATVLWSYNVDAIGGAVTTSPVISWDTGSASPSASVLGKKVAFVESAPGQTAHFHVLAWRAGDGQDTTDAHGLQNTMKPVSITSFVVTDPAAGSGTATDLPLIGDTAGPDTFSPPFVDYTHDYAYVGNDAGDLYRIKDVFCPSFNTDAGCTAGLAPSLDATWGTAGVVEVGGECGNLTGAVEDFATGNVFVGCSDGNLYGFTSTGARLSPTRSVNLGVGAPYGGLLAPPIVDSTNGLVYAVTGTNGTTPVLLQTSTTFTGTRRVGLGGAPTTPGDNLFAPAFNDAYFSSATTTNWAVFSCGYDPTGSFTLLYAVGFNASRLINTTTPPPTSNQYQILNAVDQCSPLTSFVNAQGPPNPPTDWLFLGLGNQDTVYNFNVSVSKGITGAGFPGGFTSTATNATVNGGPSGIIVDNENDTLAQASSIYFSNLASATCGAGGSGFCAVKLTQAGLN